MLKIWPLGFLTSFRFPQDYQEANKDPKSLFKLASENQEISRNLWDFSKNYRFPLNFRLIVDKHIWFLGAPPHGVATGEKFNSKPKDCLNQMMLFPRALRLVTSFPKIINKTKFSIKFSSNPFKVFGKFSIDLFFSPNARKTNAVFVNF